MDTQDQLIKWQEVQINENESGMQLCVEEDLVVGAMESAFEEMVTILFKKKRLASLPFSMQQICVSLKND